MYNVIGIVHVSILEGICYRLIRKDADEVFRHSNGADEGVK